MDSAASTSNKLEENLTIASAPALLDSIKALTGKPAIFDAGDVKHLDLPALQILLSACDTWKSQSLPFEIHNISDNFQMGLEIMGINLNAISTAETA